METQTKNPTGGGHTGRRVAVCVALVAVVLLVVGLVLGRAPKPDEAFVVGDHETRAETIVVAAPEVTIAGDVAGDVVAWARRVEVTGTIRGNLIVFAGDVEIGVPGIVEGGVQCLCRQLSIRGDVGGNAYALANTAVVTTNGRVERDLVALASFARVDGEVGRDARLHVADAILTGSIGRDVRGDVTRLGASARTRVGGDVRLEASEPNDVHVDTAASVGGVIDVEEAPEDSKYRHVGWWMLQLVQLFGAFFVGLVLTIAAPQLFTLPLRGMKATAVHIGIGLLVLVVAPILFVLAMLSLVGLPLGVIGLGLYVLALYLAGIVVAGRLGHAMIRRHLGRTALGLFVGLLLLAVATEVPYLGPVIAFVVIVIGLGIMVRVIAERRRR